jgi:ATP-dependent Lhr-like helicase
MQFLALVEAGRNGLMPLRAPYSLYGAVAQQCLSMIHSDEEYSVRTVDLCRLFGHLSHLDRPTVECILAELVGSEYLHRHGFKNRYAAAEKLHRLVDLRMIYGNYGAGSQEVTVRHGAKELGTVPATNLLRLGHGDTVRFAGQCWRIRKASPDGFDLEPIKANSVGQDFLYGGSGIQSDSFVTNLIWQQLCDNAFSLELLDSAMLPLIEQKLNALRSCDSLHIPTQRNAQCYQYDTYAGYLVNKAIGLITKQTSFTATNVTLTTAYPVPWHQIPTDPHSYEIIFPQLFEADSRQSIFQTVLPPDLQREEFLQAG